MDKALDLKLEDLSSSPSCVPFDARGTSVPLNSGPILVRSTLYSLTGMSGWLNKFIHLITVACQTLCQALEISQQTVPTVWCVCERGREKQRQRQRQRPTENQLTIMQIRISWFQYLHIEVSSSIDSHLSGPRIFTP